jgi:hypothetical protein
MSERAKLLTERLERHIERYKANRNISRRASSLIRLLAILISGTVTVVLGVKGYFPRADLFLSVSAIIGSALLTALTAWEAFADYGAVWVRRMRIVNGLCQIRDELSFLTAGGRNLSEEEEVRIFDRMQLVLHAQDDWLTRRERAVSAPLQGRMS